jgi:hypothetical protein
VRIFEEDSSDPEKTSKPREWYRLKGEIYEKGTGRDKLILNLDSCTPLRPLSLSQELEEFQKFRSQVELMADREITKELRKAIEAIRARVPGTFSSGVNLGHVITKQKGKEERPSPAMCHRTIAWFRVLSLYSSFFGSFSRIILKQ